MINEETKYDVVVVGSGPAGVAAAITCRRSGLTTALVSLCVPPHAGGLNPNPSESVHPGIAALLEMIGAGEAVEVSSRATYEGITVSGNYQALGADESGVWTGHHIDRVLFDNYLLAAAGKQGVIIEPQAVSEIIEEKDRVTGVRLASGKTIRAQYVVDASGHKRLAGKKLKFREEFYSPAFFVWTGLCEHTSPDLFNSTSPQFIPHANGWTWLAPEAPGRCTWTRLSILGEKEPGQPGELEKHGTTRETFAFNRRWRAFRPLVKEGLILCGDAAAIIDPSAGQGILNALRSGIKAGQCVQQCILNSPAESFLLAQYDHWFMQEYEEKAARLKTYYAEMGIRMFEGT